MAMVTLNFPDDVFSALRRSPEEFAQELRLAAAMLWYQQGRISMEKGARIAGVNLRDFLDALARERIDVFRVKIDELERSGASVVPPASPACLMPPDLVDPDLMRVPATTPASRGTGLEWLPERP